MKLHWSPRSPFVRKVMIVAHERGVADRIVCVRTIAALTRPHAELMTDNPLSKIPTLVLDDGTALYDSRVICEYLDALPGSPQLFPAEPNARLDALRRQALGDGLLDILVLARNERDRAHPSDLHLASWAARRTAALNRLDEEAAALSSAAFGIGHVAIGCALAYLDFRFSAEDWRRTHSRIAAWHAAFALRPSVRVTEFSEDS